MSSSTSLRDQQRVVVALLNRASTTHRLTILDQLVSDASSPFELIAERSLRLTLPKDDDLLRSLLSSEIETHGEAETLVRWALKFTATTSFFFVLQLKSAEEGPRSQNVGDLFMTDYAPQLWEKYGQDEIYVSPHHAAAEMQVELLFPDSAAEAPVDTLTLQTESVPAPEAPGMMHTVSSSSEGGGSGFSQASALSSASTAATSIVSPTRPQSRASLVHPTSSTAFKARAIPNTVKSRPSIEPRLSKAAALRMGVQLPDSPASSSQSRKTGPSKDAAAAANIGISSVTKRPVAPPVSLKAPSIAPRLNKAALARQGGSSEAGHAAVTRRPASAAGHVFPSTSGGTGQARPRKQVDFSTTPGHKRLSLVGQSSIASIAPPSIAPRQNRASMSRLQHHPNRGSAFVPTRSAAAAAAAAAPSPFRGAGTGHARALSVTSTPTAPAHMEGEGDRPRKPIDFAHTPGHKRASLPLTIPSFAAPSVAPRQNRASLARTRPHPPTTTTAVSPRSTTKPLPPSLNTAPSPAPPPPPPPSSSTTTTTSGGGGGKETTQAASNLTGVANHKRTSLLNFSTGFT